MERKGLIDMIRYYLYDTAGQIWKDREINRMIDNAVKAYSEDTGIYHAQADFVPDVFGNYYYPDDFIHFQCGWNVQQGTVSASCSHEIEYHFSDPLTVKGVPEFIYDDLNDDLYNNRQYRLCPVPENMQNVAVSIYGYGDLADDDGNYGVIDNLSDYGVFSGIVSYDFAGDMMYSRYASYSEVKDYTALMYHVLFQAFNMDTDFTDPDKAGYFKSMYENRIAMFKQVKHKNTGKTMNNNFF